MKRTLLFANLMLSAAILATAQKTPESMLGAALHQEEVQGDLKGAIAAYQKVLTAPGVSRKTAAEALIHLGQCYEKLGNADSRQAYERVVKDYGDQKEAVAIARAKLGSGAATQNAGVINRQVWTGPNVDTYGAVAPDGRVLSFTDWSTGNLALHDFSTGQDRRLTNEATWNSAVFAIGSAISRDGKQAAYGWGLIKGNPQQKPFFEVRLIDMIGGAPRVLFANPELNGAYVHDWSPDGKWLAVQMQRVDRTAQIGLLSTHDGALRVLRSIDWRGVSRMAFSQDGRYLAYDLPVSDDSEQREIHVMAVDGTRETTVAQPANDKVVGWSSDGKLLLFTSDRTGLRGIWALPVTEGKPQGTPELIRANINPGSLGLTRSGALYYSVVASGSDIYVSSVDFETGKVLSPGAILPQPYVGLNGFAQWSPDGKYLAYLSRKDSAANSWQLNELAIRSMETATVRTLRPNLAYLNDSSYDNYSRPLWSPDGSCLLVNAQDMKGRQGIYRIDAQNGQAAPLVIGEPGQGNVSGVAWSPDGGTLYISRDDIRSNERVILARDIQSGKEREIVRRSRFAGIALSPDGKSLAAAGLDSATKSASLFLVPAAGGEPRELLRVSIPETLGGFLAWSPDGKFLHFRKFLNSDPPRARLPWRISVEGGTPRRVDLSAAAVGGHPSVHPDGRQVAFTGADGSKLEIWALENFVPTLKASK